MNYSIDYKAFSSVFAVPSDVVEKYIRVCSGTALKVLLCILANQKAPIAAPHLSGLLGLPPSDIDEALDYWVKAGILCPASGGFSAEPLAYQQETLSPQSKKNKVVKVTTQKNMSIQEINTLAKSDPHIGELVGECQGVMGRALSPSEIEVLCSLYTYAGLSPAYILLVVAYCINKGKNAMRYIEKVAYSLLEKEIDTYEKAEKYLSDCTARETNEGTVKSAFGIYNRRLTTQEKNMIQTWFGTYGYDIAMIRLAYERTIDSIGKLSFPYINTILSSWHQKGITCAEEAARESAAFKGSTSNKGDGTFQNSSFDLDELQYHITYGKSPLK